MIIVTTRTVEEYIGKIYTNYDIAYAGENFTNAFNEFNKSFITDLQNAITSHAKRYRGVVANLVLEYYTIHSYGEIVLLYKCSFNPIRLTQLMFYSHSERVSKGLPSTPPPLVSSTKRASDYSYYTSGGTFGISIVDIVKKKNSSKRKPMFNYYNRSTRAIMFDYDFFSAYPFDGNQADAWATDGHKYRLPFMTLIETRKQIDSIITETINNYLRNNLLIT